MAALTLVQANVNQVKILWCDFCGEGHASGHCVLEGYVEEANYAKNYQVPDPYTNIYNPWWDNPPSRELSLLEETMHQFMKMTQRNFEAIRKYHETISRDHETPMKNLEKKMHNYLNNWHLDQMELLMEIH